MKNKKGAGAKAGSLEGKGFYIVLFLCAAVIGVSAWILIANAGTNVEDDTAEAVTVDISDAAVTIIPANSPLGTENAEDAAAEAETENTMSAIAETEDTQTQAVMSSGVVSYVWPVSGGIDVPYSIQTLMYDATMADWRTHDGIDIACDLGTQVIATAAGTVVSVENDDLYGTTVEIDHANGLHSIYANLAAEPPVSVGDTVTMGQIIGSVGSTAICETNQVSHLHFAMTSDGLPTDPTAYLPAA
ncbi:MAG: M23 family metallopeptidase [Oscillospiraceae bacterium]|nr:M23 family metallopeptidase [Oscillospiraceae bacterium]